MAEAHKFFLSVTAGSTYDSHEDVHVNSTNPTKISTENADVEILVQVKDFRAAPNSKAASSSAYFTNPSRTSARYSISFAIVPKRDISCDALLLGNDFDAPIRDQLPPFFGKALSFVKSWIDPGLDGDAYADKPHLYGPMASSVNALRIGDKGEGLSKAGGGGSSDEQHVVEEGGSESGMKIRQDLKIPDDAAGRQKYFLSKENRKEFNLEEGRRYDFDFFNGYLDFNDFALKLPMGLSFNILRQLGGENVQPLRYVLRDQETDTVLFHVTFTLVSTEDDDGKEKGKEGQPKPPPGAPETTEDDVD